MAKAYQYSDDCQFYKTLKLHTNTLRSRDLTKEVQESESSQLDCQLAI